MFNDRSLWELTQAQQKERLAWAQQERLLKLMRVKNQSYRLSRLWWNAVVKIGDVSIAVGHWLKQRPIL
jgi:hypothetical protein